MSYKYKSTCRFSMLIQVEDRIVQIRPLQEIVFKREVDHPYLKLVEEPKKKPGRRKKEITHGNSSDTSSN